ncbi:MULTISPECIES: hypothetical protein [Burkholderiaceae]|uniref:hypothetical protein n=1 Tax=Burkholderiaceae TaxID=119060 RepID=UPI0011158F69|nr:MULTISPECIES: hypothetical protein [Burkholderiaceae]MCF2135265.1 hypothetical protein [Mycetohabitans sp. B3]MCG1040780.1 hypothetical protein [Mycetohabitans sp. B7]
MNEVQLKGVSQVTIRDQNGAAKQATWNFDIAPHDRTTANGQAASLSRPGMDSDACLCTNGSHRQEAHRMEAGHPFVCHFSQAGCRKIQLLCLAIKN